MWTSSTCGATVASETAFDGGRNVTSARQRGDPDGRVVYAKMGADTPIAKDRNLRDWTNQGVVARACGGPEQQRRGPEHLGTAPSLLRCAA